jgi:hypothetical protein
MKHLEQQIQFTRAAFEQRMRPSMVLTQLLDSIEAKYHGHTRRIEVFHCVFNALRMPFSEVLSLGGWSGFGDGYTFSDADVDNLLQPWIGRHLGIDWLEIAQQASDRSNSG